MVQKIRKNIKTLVVSGGGFKGIAFIGVFKKLQEENVILERIAGVSAGSIFGLMYIAGYTAEEMQEHLVTLDLDSLKNISLLHFMSTYGIDSGKNIVKWLSSLLEDRGIDPDITFQDLYTLTDIAFIVYTANINTFSYQPFSHLETPNAKVLDAIRMSIGIPLVFSATRYNLETCKISNDTDDDIFVDGGVINNYPIHLFDESLDTTLGLKLTTPEPCRSSVKIEGIESYLYNAASCYLVHKSSQTLLSEKYKNHTIFVDTKNITSTLNFNLTPHEILQLIECGYQSTDVLECCCEDDLKLKIEQSEQICTCNVDCECCCECNLNSI